MLINGNCICIQPKTLFVKISVRYLILPLRKARGGP
jgi:hypothetical protein